MEFKTEKQVQEDLSNGINNMSFDIKKFIEATSCDHRTLQQKFTEICLSWIVFVGSDEYQYDGRNEFSHIQCEKIFEFMVKNNVYPNMPLI